MRPVIMKIQDANPSIYNNINSNEKELSPKKTNVSEKSNKILSNSKSLQSKEKIDNQVVLKKSHSAEKLEVPLAHDKFLEILSDSSQPLKQSSILENVEIVHKVKSKNLEKKNGVFSNCIKRKRDKASGGYLYTFTANNELKDAGLQEMNKIQQSLFPATQSTHGLLIDAVKSLNNNPFFHELGYKTDGSSVTLPDEKVLTARWMDLRIKDPSLPELRFISSEGIADDKTFIKTILEGYLILSSDCEFLHDQYAHIISHIHMIAFGSHPENTYEVVMGEFKEKADSIINEIEKIENSIWTGPTAKEKIRVPSELLWARLGAVVDGTLSFRDLTTMKDWISNWKSGGNSGDWQSYMEKRFGDQYVKNKEDLNLVWEDIVDEVRARKNAFILKWLENLKKSKAHVARNEEYSKKNGIFSICEGKKHDALSGGYLYTFKAKEKLEGREEDELKKMQRYMYPAEEFHDTLFKTIEYLNENPTFHLLQEVGYSVEGNTLILPDHKVLTVRWAELRSKDSSLPELKFISSQGMYDDKTFINAILDGYLVVSDDALFLHNTSQIIHHIYLISVCDAAAPMGLIYDSLMDMFKIKIKEIVKEINKIENNIENSQFDEVAQKNNILSVLLWARLRSAVDSTLFSADLHDLQARITYFESLGNSQQWQSYMEREFADSYIKNKKGLETAWENILDNLKESTF